MRDGRKALLVCYFLLGLYLLLLYLIPIFVVAITFMVVWLFISDIYGYKLENIAYCLVNAFFTVKEKIDIFFSLCRAFLVWFGHFTIATLLGISLFLFVVKLFPWITGYFPEIQEYQHYFSDIFSSKLYWAVSSTIVATTLALGHIRNFNINANRFYIERSNYYKKEIE